MDPNYRDIMRLYQYVGSPDVLPRGDFPPRLRLDDRDAFSRWLAEREGEIDGEGCVAATFVVDAEGIFWIAERATEHVSCARLGPVQSAGEVFFTAHEKSPVIVRITNQSAGYCPEPDSWRAVEDALSRAGADHPGRFDPAFEFRRCPQCSTVAIVKDEDYTCLVCGAALPTQWNVDP